MISNFTHAAKQALLGSPCVKELSPLMPSLEFFLVPYPLTQKEISLFTAWTHHLEEEGIFNALYLQSKLLNHGQKCYLIYISTLAIAKAFSCVELRGFLQILLAAERQLCAPTDLCCYSH